MNGIVRFATFLPLVLLFASGIGAQRSSYDPAAGETNTQRDSFVDFALKQANSQDTDYGRLLDVGRKLMVDKTVGNIGFWTLLVTFSLLVLSFFLLLFENRERNRREIITSEFLAQYHNAWVDAIKQAEKATRYYNDLDNKKIRAVETGLLIQTPESGSRHKQTEEDHPGRNVKSHISPVDANRNNQNENGRSDRTNGGKAAVRYREGDLLAQIRTLQQQLHEAHEREKHLQMELRKIQVRVLPAQSNHPDLAS